MKVDRIIEAGICVMLAAFVGTLYMSLHENVVKAGDKAPDFSFRADNGKTVAAHDFGGKLLLVNFWASWCAPCVEEMPALNEMARELGQLSRPASRSDTAVLCLPRSVLTDLRK